MTPLAELPLADSSNLLTYFLHSDSRFGELTEVRWIPLSGPKLTEHPSTLLCSQGDRLSAIRHLLCQALILSFRSANCGGSPDWTTILMSPQIDVSDAARFFLDLSILFRRGSGTHFDFSPYFDELQAEIAPGVTHLVFKSNQHLAKALTSICKPSLLLWVDYVISSPRPKSPYPSGRLCCHPQVPTHIQSHTSLAELVASPLWTYLRGYHPSVKVRCLALLPPGSNLTPLEVGQRVTELSR